MRLRLLAVVAGCAFGLVSGSVQASFLATFKQVGSDVVLTGLGTINTSGLGRLQEVGTPSYIEPELHFLVSGQTQYYNGGFPEFLAYRYHVTVSGPHDFGVSTPSSQSADESFGDTFGLDQRSDDVDDDGGPDMTDIFVPDHYTSGDLISGSSIYKNQTFASLGLDPGTYVYSFQDGRLTDTFTVQIGAVPLPSSAPMLGAALLALGAVGHGLKRKKAAAKGVGHARQCRRSGRLMADGVR